MQAHLAAGGAGVLLLGVAGLGASTTSGSGSRRGSWATSCSKLREDVFDATIRHDMSFFDEHPSGKIVSRVTSDTQDFAEVVTLVINLVSQVLLVVVLTVWLPSDQRLAHAAAAGA